MVNWWLVVLAVFLGLLCMGLAIYVLFYLRSEDDEDGGYLAQVIVVLGMFVATIVVLLLPLDAANSPDPTVENVYSNTLNTELMWQVVLGILFVLTLFVVPFTMFYYEAYDPDKKRIIKQIRQALLYTVAICAFFFIVCGICFWKIGVSILPVMAYQTVPQFVDVESEVLFEDKGTNVNTEISVTFFTYCIGMLCFFSWIAFIFYCGVGLVSFPIDLIFGFIRRPKRISGMRFAQEMSVIGAKGDMLLELALKMQQRCRESVSRGMQSKINIIRNETYVLEVQQDQLIWAYTKAGGSPFLVYGKLLLAIFALCTSCVWVLHIVLYNALNMLPFLNDFLNMLDGVFALFGIVAYALFTFYLMWITFEGQMRLGIRVAFFQIHPIRAHDTTLNSLIFNVLLCLLTSVAVIQFAARSFADYAPRTAINGLMNVFVLHLKYIGLFIEWAYVCLLVVALLSTIWVLMCPIKSRSIDPTKIRVY